MARVEASGRQVAPARRVPHYLIAGPVAEALKNILRVEFVGFLLAAAAAVYEAFA